MNNRLSCNLPLNPPQNSGGFTHLVTAAIFCLLTGAWAWAGDAPAWMRAHANRDLRFQVV
jgi:hypothetical protein